MGLIRAAREAISSMLADQWREYFYCDSLSNDVLMVKGQKRVQGNSSNTKGRENIITNGSIIAVNEGQCMIIVEQGGVADLCAEAGEYIFDTSTEPSLFYGGLGEGVKKTAQTMLTRFTFGGDTAKDQRVYFFNTKEIMSNLFGTPNPVPFRVVDRNIGLDVDIAVRCNGEYSFRMSDPLLFYKNVCGNVTDKYERSQIAGQMKSELLTALQPAFAKISAMGVRYSMLPAHSMEISRALREELTGLWQELRGLEVVTVNINSAKASEEDENRIRDLQMEAAYGNSTLAQAKMNVARANALEKAAANDGGSMLGFMGLNMADAMGTRMGQQSAVNAAGGMTGMANAVAGAAGAAGAGMGMGMQAASAAAPVLGWTCSCGQGDNRGRFCSDCGEPKPPAAGWTCSCGTVNQGKFCTDCGSKKPEGASLYKCDKCGWEPENPADPPKFCPQCGDRFDENDIR